MTMTSQTQLARPHDSNSGCTGLDGVPAGVLTCQLLPMTGFRTERVLMSISALMIVVFATGCLIAPPQHTQVRLTADQREQCLQVLRSGMGSDEFWPSMHAAEALTVSGHADEVRQYLSGRLNDKLDDQQRCGVARELVRAGDADRVSILFTILNSDDDFGHVHAAESLYKVYVPGDMHAIQDAFNNGSSDSFRLMAAATLAKSGDENAIAFIRDMLRSDNATSSRIAAWILGRVGSAEDIPGLHAELSEDHIPLERAFLEHALAALGDPTGLAALSVNLDDSDPAIRTYAAVFAGETRSVSLSQKLLGLLQDSNRDVRVRAAQALLLMSIR
jgi:HEAT repeat protein